MFPLFTNFVVKDWRGC